MRLFPRRPAVRPLRALSFTVQGGHFVCDTTFTLSTSRVHSELSLKNYSSEDPLKKNHNNVKTLTEPYKQVHHHLLSSTRLAAPRATQVTSRATQERSHKINKISWHNCTHSNDSFDTRPRLTHSTHRHTLTQGLH